MKWGIVSDLGLKRYKKWEENRRCSQQSIASLLCRGANLTLHHEIGLEEKWCNYPSISFLSWNKGKLLTLACSWKKKKKNTPKTNQQTKKSPNPTKQKPWAEVKMPWKLKTEIKERKLSLNIAELQNCRLSLRSSLGPRSLPPDLSLLANSSLRAWKEKIPICWQFAQVCSQSPSLAIKSIPFRFPTLVANAF